MRIVALSDTHGAHGRLVVPAAHVLVCAGDFTRHGTWDEIDAFLAWFGACDAGERVLIGGNHDAGAEAEPERMRERCAELDIRWLVDEGATVAGLRVWGSPYTPPFKSTAFARDRAEAARGWSKIPAGLDLLVTHGPPAGIRDRAVLGHVGCEALRAAVLGRPPRLHVFGHIHEAHGEQREPGCPTRFVNVAIKGIFGGVRAPTVLDLSVTGRGSR